MPKQKFASTCELQCHSELAQQLQRLRPMAPRGWLVRSHRFDGGPALPHMQPSIYFHRSPSLGRSRPQLERSDLAAVTRHEKQSILTLNADAGSVGPGLTLSWRPKESFLCSSSIQRPTEFQACLPALEALEQRSTRRHQLRGRASCLDKADCQARCPVASPKVVGQLRYASQESSQPDHPGTDILAELSCRH